jgi:hypothetical protein
MSHRTGTWGNDESNETLNWREFTNIVESASLECKAVDRKLTNLVVCLFTDNSTTEAAMCKGSSSSQKLLALVIRLKITEAKCSIHLVACHVAGTQMIIVKGGNGVSRGLLNKGVMAREPIPSFIPLHLSALERAPDFLPWISSWSCKGLEVLKPKDWCELGHDIRGWTHPQQGELFARSVLRKGLFVWFPPTAAANVAFEQLRIARVKQQQSTHVDVAPRLLTPRWLRQMWKACDVILPVPSGTPGWPQTCMNPF